MAEHFIFPAADGFYTSGPDGLHKISDTVAIGELPKGEWHMNMIGGTIVIVDRSGNNPAMWVREGKLEVIDISKAMLDVQVYIDPLRFSSILPRELTDEEKSEMYWESNTRGDDENIN